MNEKTDAAAWVKKTRADQGLPPTIADRGVRFRALSAVDKAEESTDAA
ncbi:hypothetical protein [Arthrobacter sp. CAN_C5]|nr:hypothetical protein [Arthrobacter sp. CAN_C5]MBP2215986.1 hypothetical protein [Arthrobacter sp. CAN_C5]